MGANEGTKGNVGRKDHGFEVNQWIKRGWKDWGGKGVRKMGL